MHRWLFAPGSLCCNWWYFYKTISAIAILGISKEIEVFCHLQRQLLLLQWYLIERNMYNSMYLPCLYHNFQFTKENFSLFCLAAPQTTFWSKSHPIRLWSLSLYVSLFHRFAKLICEWFNHFSPDAYQRYALRITLHFIYSSEHQSHFQCVPMESRTNAISRWKRQHTQDRENIWAE